jgi:O-antigen ligase
MLAYPKSSPLFYLNHAHNEYLQLLAGGGALLAVPVAGVMLAAAWRMMQRLRSDRTTAVFWIRAGAASGILGVVVQSVWETTLRMPANAVLFALVAAIALHDPERYAHAGRTVLNRRTVVDA